MKCMVFIVGMTLVAGAANARSSWSGTWRAGVGRNATGEFRTVDRDGDVEFQLQLWGGPSSEASGFADGHLSVRDGRAVFETTEWGGKCRIEFVFEQKQVTIEQKEGGSGTCGFGIGIEAYGTFVRRSRKPPKFRKF